MDPRPVVVTDQDSRRIRGALRRSSAAGLGAGVEELSRKLQLAVQVSSDRIGGDVVTLDSQVSLEDPDTGSLERYTLILPGDSEIGVDRLSVLAPLGGQLLGPP